MCPYSQAKHQNGAPTQFQLTSKQSNQVGENMTPKTKATQNWLPMFTRGWGTLTSYSWLCCKNMEEFATIVFKFLCGLKMFVVHIGLWHLLFYPKRYVFFNRFSYVFPLHFSLPSFQLHKKNPSCCGLKTGVSFNWCDLHVAPSMDWILLLKHACESNKKYEHQTYVSEICLSHPRLNHKSSWISMTCMGWIVHISIDITIV